MSEQDYKENIKKPSGKNRWLQIIYSKWLVRNIPFYLFVSALAILYIANGHYADKMIRDINTKANNLKEKGYEFKIAKRDVIFRSKESELAKAVEPLGLKELVAPPVRLIDSSSKK